MTERKKEWIMIIGVIGISIAVGMLANFLGIDLIPAC